MNLVIKRKYFSKDYIVGDVYLDDRDSTFIGNSLEPSLSTI